VNNDNYITPDRLSRLTPADLDKVKEFISACENGDTELMERLTREAREAAGLDT